ncbi:very short patch repair endonuclease [Acidithiobacillus thiooxidans]|uniref:Very short patch repair endonuclease n=1 Tax=Acidithiobacillus thiooxidans ATCC 19377 TaxID=637390 RepID=A0A543Q1B3_ACITH|nr:DNA mismatch endonuclease Vsr [Acidithiobacillus thiooxidans]MDX5933161.1 DNA mismatch endonuclease Vsr [Acidithiobacillus thiooxidans]TQN50125.1 XorII very short patch repair endonuclease [Acidithiobacillus thiooxidans ATCC 19377]
MTDSLSKAKRSWNMSRIRSKDTKPELLVRSLLHCDGYRFRIHKSGLPGKPDIVLAKHKTVVFVHGCFWHRHNGCSDATTPKTRTVFWKNKFEENMARDKRTVAALIALNWNVVIVWECELKNPNELLERLRREISKPAV